MLKRVCRFTIFIISIFLILNWSTEEIKTTFVYEQEKVSLKKEADITKLEIPEWNLERIIKKGSVNQIDNLFATLIVGNKNNIIIAGHDIPFVFHPLQNIKIGMNIYLTKGNKITKYNVTKILRVKPTEVKYLEETKEEQLTLITCTENDQKRLIIIGTKLS